VAALRAAGARSTDPVRHNPDNLAERLISRRYRFLIRVPPLRAIALLWAERELAGLPLFITARTKHLDAIVLGELRGGIKQVAILGAGADTRAYRFGPQYPEVAFVEVDHPATSAWKQDRVRRVFGPTAVRYAPIDFHSQKLADAFGDLSVPTLFVWEGVTPYLTAEAIDETLATITRFAPGSSVAFDYVYRSADGASKLQAYLARHNEPLLFGLDPDQVEDFLAKRGLELVSNATAEDLVREHLTGSDGRPIGTSLEYSGIAHARVPQRVS
jgi:methyltransferase (TIGR00027 family)